MASRRDVVTFLTAPARSGKSFNEVRRICDDTLPQETGPIYTNLPLYPDRIAEYCWNKHKVPVADTLERIRLIPRDMELEWKNAGQPIYDENGMRVGTETPTGPWDYFADKELSGATIIIDEIHNFCGSIGTPKAIANQWQKWLGELGHNQAVFRCLSQSPEKVHPCIKQEAQAAYTIRNTGLDTDPYFKIEIYDWLELWCGLLGGEYKVFVFEQETKKVEGKAVQGKRTLHRMGPPYFDFYDSFNAPIAHAQAKDVKPFEHEFERQMQKGALRGRLALLWWFFRKHFYELSTRGLIAVFLVALVIGLMSGTVPRYLSKTIIGITTSATGKPKLPGKSAAALPGTAPDSVPAKAVKELERKAEALAKRLDLAMQEKAKLERELQNASALVLIADDTITLRGGFTYAVGDVIDTGPYKGRKFLSINWARRSATLNDGTILKLGVTEDATPTALPEIEPAKPTADPETDSIRKMNKTQKGDKANVKNYR
jgi:hypothetical protein